ncbi:hypothetical protein BAUCODRAFT_121021 [Baudoinia panamericana UAMH 10762]|uniref:Uncharacterized protein n=1 Tax=Baudoinia panamericana (strain UAMH 10762) TaxID=717646 RepID=M2LU92_BAUPA|nr:uncharacterized protein BAUCODRAFT_121021 [Baudoinia panamericana UAMH 10762]EMC98122.1 hypothetical protein BAUCODRAFT_121021 [Baudoinia panamericana UAMH 10762]
MEPSDIMNDCLETGDLAKDVNEQDTVLSKKTTRSGRSRKKPQAFAQSSHSAPSGPCNITIRGAANSVELTKRTETHELSSLTKNNTKKNKGTSVLPKMRLLKLAAETMRTDVVGEQALIELSNLASDGAETPMSPGSRGKRAVTWAEVLVSVYQPSADSESGQVYDEPEERMPWEKSANFDPTVGVADEKPVSAPAAADTPSKPKIRRLKPPKTSPGIAEAPAATSAARNAVAVNEGNGLMGAVDPSEAQPKAAPKSRRSRIATPAKGLTKAPLPHAESRSEEQSHGILGKNTSKAPASTSRTVPSNTAGKENLISSPPKKRAGALPRANALGSKLELPKADSRLAANVETETLSGLGSPAKKAPKASFLFGAPAAAGKVAVKPIPPASLSSPAKKRPRRTAV